MTWSQFSEDDITLALVEQLNPPHMFLEIGCGDGSENNTRILTERGWCGLWVDGDPKNTEAAIALKIPGVQVFNRFLSLDYSLGIALHMPEEFGVLSIDIDGNDYHIWKALCSGKYGLRPYIVIIEAQIQRPHDVPYVMPYDANYRWTHDNDDNGASVCSMVELGSQLGYRFVGKCPDHHSPNLFFVRNDLDAATDR